MSDDYGARIREVAYDIEQDSWDGVGVPEEAYEVVKALLAAASLADNAVIGRQRFSISMSLETTLSEGQFYGGDDSMLPLVESLGEWRPSAIVNLWNLDDDVKMVVVDSETGEAARWNGREWVDADQDPLD